MGPERGGARARAPQDLSGGWFSKLMISCSHLICDRIFALRRDGRLHDAAQLVLHSGRLVDA